MPHVSWLDLVGSQCARERAIKRYDPAAIRYETLIRQARERGLIHLAVVADSPRAWLSDAYAASIVDWCDKYIIGRCTSHFARQRITRDGTYYEMWFVFELEADAIMFKLMWA